MKMTILNFFKRLKTCLFAAVGLGLVSIGTTHAQTQNSLWSLAPNYIPSGSLPLPLPNYDYFGQPATYGTHNAMHDADGNLMFYMVDYAVYDKDGYHIDDVFYNGIYVCGTAEIAFVPDPANCDRYYIIAAGRSGYTLTHHKLPYYSVLDMSEPNWNYPSRPGALEYGANGTATSIASMTPGFFYSQTGPGKQGGCFIAASGLRPNNSRLVFISNGIGIYRYKIDANGFNYDNYFLPYGSTTFNTMSVRTEMELVELAGGNYRIAVAFNHSSGDIAVFTAELDNTGTLVTGTDNILLLNVSPSDLIWPYVHGLEFSPDGSKLYITHNSSTLRPNPFEYYDFSNPTAGIQSLMVPNAADFESSQIELGKDGKLYLATNNRLATLSNPNNPNVGNWTNNAQAITYAPNYEGVSTQDYPLKSYLLPDQIDGMDYNAHFFANTQCCLANAGYDADEFTATTSATWLPGSNPFGSVSGVVQVEKELRIPAGKTITIQNMTFEFAPGAKVIIERGTGTLSGGKLIMDNTTFTVDDRCDADALWMGIQVYGYQNQNQIPLSTTQQGWLIMRNNSVIEYAHKGAIAVKHNTATTYPYNFTTYDFSYTGGIIQAKNSKFLNNRQDVEFRAYNTSNGIPNRSYLSNCEFITDNQFKNQLYYPGYHAVLENVDGVDFLGNDFKNLDPDTYSHWQQGSGILSINSQYRVNARCSSLSLPCSSYDPNVFENLYFGVYNHSYNGTKTIEIDRNTFTNNYFGAYLGGMQAPTVTRNDFKVYRSATPNQTFSTYGLYLNGCTGYQVEENTFTEFNDPLVSPGGNTYGVIVNNSGEDHNEIYRNDFYDIKIGGQSQNINGTVYVPNDPNSPIMGLQWKCNDFTNDLYQADLAVTSGRIDYQQGYLVSPAVDPSGALTAPAGNRFSHSTFDPQNDIAVNNSAQQFQYVHHADLITTPLYYNAALVSPVMNFNPTYPVYYTGDACPSKVRDGGIIVHSPGFKLKADSLKALIETKETELATDPQNEELIQEIGFLRSYRENIIDQHIGLFLKDTTAINPLDSVIAILGQEQGEMRKKQLLDAYIIKDEVAAITQTRDDIVNTYGYDNFIKMADVQQAMKAYPSPYIAINEDAEIKQDVEDVANDTNDPVNAAKAQALLALTGIDLFLPEVEKLELVGGGLRSGVIDNQTSESTGNLSIYPNPSGGGAVTIQFNGELPENARVDVFDVTGKLVQTYRFNSENNYILLQSGTFSPGIYMVKVYNDTRLIEIQKLVINQ